MLSISNFFAQFMSAFLTGFFTLEFSIFSVLGGVGKALPKAPDDFTPVVRFAVCSDVHLTDPDKQVKESDKINCRLHAEHFVSFFKDAYKYAENNSKYNRLDAVVVCGDMTGGGAPDEYTIFNNIVSENIKDSTQLLCVLGNHEFIDYRDDDPTVAYTMYKKYVHNDVDRHVVINGYHFVLCSYADDAKTFNGKTGWLGSEIKKAVADTGDKPVFVFQHPQPFNTVYGSINWGTLEIKSVLVNYPQVVDFSGHSHYTPTDPRSIWQGSFTAVGTGSTAALMGNLDYISGDEDAPGESGAFWIVEADAKGNVRLQVVDLVNHKMFEKNDYYLSNVAKQSSHLLTWANLKSLDTAPEFPSGAVVTSTTDNDGNTFLHFPDADSFWGAENYKVSITNGLKEVWAETVISNYVRKDSNGMSVNIGKIDPGTYRFSITPYSPYAKGGSAIKGEIVVV